jgi:hypothetical protein
LTCRMASSVIARTLSGAQILGVFGPSCGIPGPCGPLYSVPSAAAAGNTAAPGNAADSAAVEQIPFIRVLLEKSELMGSLLLVGIFVALGYPCYRTFATPARQRIHFTSFLAAILMRGEREPANSPATIQNVRTAIAADAEDTE